MILVFLTNPFLSHLFYLALNMFKVALKYFHLSLVILAVISSFNFTFIFAEENTKQKTALVLSGGGARGFAHIGVIRALEEVGFYPDLIVGTSMGAVIGALYACGNTPDEIERYMKGTKWTKLFSPKPYREIEFISQKMGELPYLFSLRLDKHFNVIFPKNLLTTQSFQERIFQMTIYPEYAAGGNFDSLAIPFRAVATDIKTGKSVVLSHGSLPKTVSGSSAFPIVLAPVTLDSFLLVDGGLTNNVPIDVAKDMGVDFIVAVDVGSKLLNLGNNIDPLTFFGQTVNILAYLSDTKNIELADVLIRPNLGTITSINFDSINVLIQKGYEETELYLDKIRPYGNRNHPSPDFLQASIDRLNHTRIRKIHFVNNQETKSFVLKREMCLSEGDLWNSAFAKRSVKNLFSTGLFKNVYISLDKVSEDSADLIVEVEEDVKTRFSFGTRYDSEKKARAFVSAKYRNLFGVGIDNKLYLIASDQYRRLAWDLRNSRIFTTTLTGYFSLYSEYENIPLYKKSKRITFAEFSRNGFEANAGVQVRRVGLTSVGIKYEHVSVDSVLPNIPLSKYGVGSVIFRILVENTDHYDLPTKGRVNKIFFEHSISEDELEHFDKISVESTVYETYSEKYTFSTHLRLGYLTSSLSYFELFRLGGVSSLPGYHQDELWGKLVLALGLGCRAPLTSGSYYRFHLMCGNVWDSIEDFNWEELKVGFRAGILVPTPIGPITADYGFDLSGHRLLYFSIGHHF